MSRYRGREGVNWWQPDQIIGYNITYGSGVSTSPNYWKEVSRSPIRVTAGTVAGSQVFKESCVDQLHHGPPFKEGGSLRLKRCSNSTIQFEPLAVGLYRHPTKVYGYEGGFYCIKTPKSFWDNAVTLEESAFNGHFDNVNDYGATGWAKARPGQPGADLGVFLGEIREVPKMLRDTALFFRNSWNSAKSGRFTKHAANSWLGANFGWLPFVSDLRKFATVTKNLDKSIQQLRRDNGRWIKRARTVEEVQETVSDTGWVTGYNHAPFLQISFYKTPANAFRREVVERSAKFWFEARFKYWIPNIGTYAWKRKAIRKLYGASLNPELVWQLTPFSWLVDWCSNVGDVISNLDNNLAENLVAKYAYIMGTQRLIASAYTRASSQPFGPPSEFASHFNLELKERNAASPFGFALTGADFSARQWSLLSALGIQRLKFM